MGGAFREPLPRGPRPIISAQSPQITLDAQPTSIQPEPAPQDRRSIDLRGEFVEAYGARVFLAVSAVGALFLLPFSVHNFVQGRVVLGLATTLVALCLFCNAFAITRGRAAPFAPVFIFGPALLALGVAMYEQGLIGILWAYAAILLFHFVLPRGSANFYNVAIIALAVGMAWLHLGPAIALRVGVTMSLTLVFTNIFSSLSDAQRRKEAEQRQRLDLLVRGTNAGTLEWDSASPARLSHRLREMLGLAQDGAARREFLEFVHEEDRPRVAQRLEEQFAQRAAPRSVRPLPADDYRLVHLSGEPVWVHTEGIAVADARGRTQRLVCSFMDITEHVRAQETLIDSAERVRGQARQLERQNAQLQAAIRIREDVERMARHDLRTPLSSIASVPRLMREGGPLDARREELLSLIEHASLRVLRMVNLSLDLYRMEEGSYRTRPQPVDPGALARVVAKELEGHAASKLLRVELDLPEDLRAARGEELLCYSIVANVLKNAIEAAPDGSIVRVTLRAAATRFSDGVSLAVHNEGAVPAPIRARFFEKYATHGKSGGTGLGAYSAQLMARVQDGELTMETDDAEGTTVTLWLPVWQGVTAGRFAEEPGDPGATNEQPAPGARLPPWSLLVVDDDAYNLALLRSLLPTPPLHVREAVNGRAALERVVEQRPDFIFLDLQMPVMGGPEAIRHIRELQRARGQLPSVIVAFSAWDDEATRLQCKEAGFDHYLVKPASREEIFAILEGRSPDLSGRWDDRIDDVALSLMPEFIDSRRELLAKLRDAARSGDRAAIRTTSHMLAGSLGLYGFDTASELARRIAANAANGEAPWLAERCEELQAQFEEDQGVVRGGVRR